MSYISLVYSCPNKAGKRLRYFTGCYTGLRYSDYISPQPEHVASKNGRQFIDILTQKMRQRAVQ